MENTLAITEFCKAHNITEKQFYGKQEVGGSLYLSGLTSIPAGFNPTVGGYLGLMNKSKFINAEVRIPTPELQWENGKYISKDGILTEVISRKANVYRVRKIARKQIEYLVTDGEGTWAHGNTLKEAKEDLVYKMSDRNKSDYEHLTLSDTLVHGEAVLCYRAITGACRPGIHHFIKDKLSNNRKDEYTIADIIRLTEGEWNGSEFKAFFMSK